MIAFLRAAIIRGTIGNCVISQKGGGRYPNAQLLAVDDVGIVANVGGVTHLIPWTSINEVCEA